MWHFMDFNRLIFYNIYIDKFIVLYWCCSLDDDDDCNDDDGCAGDDGDYNDDNTAITGDADDCCYYVQRAGVFFR